MTELIPLIAPLIARAVAGNPKAAENVSKLTLALRFLGLMNINLTLNIADLTNLAGAVGGELAKLPVSSSSVPPGTTPTTPTPVNPPPPVVVPVPEPPPPPVVVLPFPPLAERRAAILSVYDEDLGRVPSEPEIQSWMAHFENGGTREQMHQAVMLSGEYIEKHTVKTFAPLPRLVQQGQHFALENGQRFTAIECSDFNLLNRWQHGEDIEPILTQRAEVGFNTLRVWTLYDLAASAIGTFLDIDYARVGDFLDTCARHGLYVEFTAYTSTMRPDHWDRLVAAVQGKTNALVELVNEEDQPANRLPTGTAAYGRPAGVLASHGSNGAEAAPVTPYWDYATFHTNGASEEQRKIGHNAMELWSGPTLTNETSRYPDVGMWASADLGRQLQLAHDSAAGAALLCAGSCFHSVQGKTSVLFTAPTLDVARVWVAGAKGVDLACQDGPYTHRIDMEGTDFLRVYERPVAGHDGIVEIGK